MGHGWTAEELTKLAGGNLLRVFSEVNDSHLIIRYRETGPCCGLQAASSSPYEFICSIPSTVWNSKPLSYLFCFLCFYSNIRSNVSEIWSEWTTRSRLRTFQISVYPFKRRMNNCIIVAILCNCVIFVKRIPMCLFLLLSHQSELCMNRD